MAQGHFEGFEMTGDGIDHFKCAIVSYDLRTVKLCSCEMIILAIYFFVGVTQQILSFRLLLCSPCFEIVCYGFCSAESKQQFVVFPLSLVLFYFVRLGVIGKD